MDIAGQIINFAYYHSSNSVYFTAEVLELKILDESSKHIHHFRTVEKKQKLNFKYSEEDCRDLLSILQERVLKIRVTGIEHNTRDPKQGPKFTIESAEVCGILAVHI